MGFVFMVKHHGVFAPAFVLATLCFSALVMAEVPLLTNGSFSQGETIPSGWQKAECDEGKVRAFRDTDHFASASASLCLESVDGPVRNGTIAQRIEDFTPGNRVGFSGLVKSDGNVDFAALALISPGVKDSWQELIVFPRIVEWKKFEATARIPREAEDLLLVLLIHGEGKVWVDDLKFLPADSIQPSPIITDFSQSYSYSFLSFEDRVDIEDGIAHIAGENGKGGVGFLKSLDLSSMPSHTPVLWAKLGKENRASCLNLILDSGNEGKRTFSYSLEQANSETFTALQPEHALAISPKVAGEPDTNFDPSAIKLFQIQGDWKPEKVDVWLDKIVLTPPDDSMRARRAAYREQLAEQLERERRQEEARLAAIKRLLNDAPHPEDGPNITRIGAATEDTIELVIEAGRVTPRKQYPYQEQSGDQIVPEKNTPEVLCRENGQVVLAPKGRVVLRKEEGNENAKLRRLGSYVVNENMISPGPLYSGEALSIETVDQAPAYRISSPKGGLPEPAVPAEVHLKSKPIGVAGNDRSVRYHVYLKLPAGKQLVQDAKYTIDLIGINTRQKQVEWTHRPKQQMAEAIHVSQIGFRPDDPMKRAFLSLWRGTGGSTTFRFEEFELIDEATGESVFSGPVRLHFSADRIESIRGDKNHTQMNVYHLDFSDFRRPGRYRVLIPEIGSSLPFPIAENVWKQAFKTSMHGFLSHRSGIALGPPFTDYERPRPMHPGDDTVIYQLERTFWSGEAASVEAELRKIIQEDVPVSDWKTCPDAWGGYMDAGDWDRRSQHLVATWEHLELLDWKSASKTGPDRHGIGSHLVPQQNDDSRQSKLAQRRILLRPGQLAGDQRIYRSPDLGPHLLLLGLSGRARGTPRSPLILVQSQYRPYEILECRNLFMFA